MLNYRLKNYFFFLVLLLISTSAFSQNKRKSQKEKSTTGSMKAGAFIDVNVAPYAASGYTPTQLVRDVLITGGNTCTTPNVSNVTVSPNQPVTDPNRVWGYFNKGTTNFPFTDGIVLVTGAANKAGNAFEANSLGDSPGTGSDADLVAAINPLAGLHDAVALEFDFVPNSTQVKFNYLFASEEYTSNFPCGNFSDGFALLLKKVGDPTYTNMAILPGGAGPVSVTNIVPSNYSCGPINAQYFAGQNTANIETNFNGRTIPLTAVADVIPGQTYHFKMVLADASDSSFNSAVFLQGGSFDIGISFVDENGVPLPDTINMCDNSPKIIKAQVAVVTGMTFQWYKDGVLIPGATNISYTATQPGVYEVRVTVPGNQCPGTAEITIVGGTTPVAQNASLKLCSTPTLSTFNLNDAIPSISTTPGAVFRFYQNQTDAVAQNSNFIANPTNYNGTDGQTLYVVVSNGGFCSKMVTLALIKEETPVAQLTASKPRICAGESVVLTALGGATYQWDNTSNTAAIQTLTLTQTTTFTVYAIGPKGCKSLQPATVTVQVVPALKSDLKGGMICLGDEITLDAGAGPNYTYTWNTGETTQTIVADTPGAYTVTIDNGVCTKAYTTEVILALVPQITNIDYNENGTLTITAVSNGPMEYSVDNGLTWQSSNVFSNIPKNAIIPIRVRVKTTTCVGVLDYFTFVVKNVITPNGDNVNDIIDFRPVINYKDFKGVIFDRYGKAVYNAEKVRPYWDGYFQGKRLPTASYWFQVSYEDPANKTTAVKTGWILLKNIE
ncbi:gliding motility-associated-like protein [Chryseobacterium defluvii]|uniref:Gliding motility-associated-like protein n=1 Tax=Chryseobacterium defluvii TaxID=160396 RepID=A0A840K728_9FLAO|nr:choice-of-anchor L domain-containing protein [Chryseobacterium defluvii]MBB4805026.1 gliding motility-associated-like protein [Chryseobacterium defluvii]